MIQYGDEVSGETVLFREEYLVLFMGRECRTKVGEVVTFEPPSQMFDIFARFNEYFSKFTEESSVV